MTNTEFNKLLRQLSGKNGLLSKDKIKAASNEVKNSVINHLVKKRQAIVKDLINEATDTAWLASCGYMYEAKNKHFDFLCTTENMICNSTPTATFPKIKVEVRGGVAYCNDPRVEIIDHDEEVSA